MKPATIPTLVMATAQAAVGVVVAGAVTVTAKAVMMSLLMPTTGQETIRVAIISATVATRAMAVIEPPTRLTRDTTIAQAAVGAVVGVVTVIAKAVTMSVPMPTTG